MDTYIDDEHFCIKCGQTIYGLNNYIKHRTTICGRKVVTTAVEETVTKSIHNSSYEPAADLFFSSLELQSSVKQPAQKMDNTFLPHHQLDEWISSESEDVVNEEEDDDVVEMHHPPPSHTKGKWVPGTKFDKINYQSMESNYMCKACNRQLATKVQYVRHLQSNLHLKNSETERHLERAILSVDENLSGKIQITTDAMAGGQPVEEGDNADVAKKRHRRKVYTKCDICRTRVPTHILGKHLISHFHYRQMLLAPADAQSCVTILDNMDRIVRQAPFQCQPCKFYANTEDSFLAHWDSDAHRQQCAECDLLCCKLCKFECGGGGSAEMGVHLRSAGHQAIVVAINRSVPIVISELKRIECRSCGGNFRYNFELRRHAALCSSVEPTSTGSNAYQSKYRCDQCGEVCKSRLALQRHIRFKHDAVGNNFYCSVCDRTFETAKDAKRHRNTALHRSRKGVAAGEKKKMGGAVKSELSELSGWEFLKVFNCQQCSHSTTTEAESILHNLLHSNSNTTGKLSCPVCKKMFKIHSLRSHLRQHTNEKPFACNQCTANFSRKQTLKAHIGNIHNQTNFGEVADRKTAANAGHERQSDKSDLHCTFCDFKTSIQNHLKRHIRQHTGEKPYACPHCEYTCSSSEYLRKHILLTKKHPGKAIYECDMCGEQQRFQTNYLKEYKSHKSLIHGKE